MTESNKRPRAEPESLQVDVDLLCVICTDLVEQAMQVNCCGALFCGPCIDEWLKRQLAGDGQGCPQCRAALKVTNVMTDVRSDRKSAAQLRRCPFYENHGCDFIGTRQELAEHNPDRCTSKTCQADKASRLATQAEQEQTIQALRRKIDSNTRSANAAARKAANEAAAAARVAATAAKQTLKSAALLSPEDILKKACKFDGATVQSTNTTNMYKWSSKDVDIRFYETNDNKFMSLYCYRPAGAEAPAGGFPRIKATVTLVSFDPAVAAEDFTREIVLESDLPLASGWGYRSWLSLQTFAKYVKDGKFALGWTVSEVT